MLAHEVVDAKVKRHGQLVHFEVFAIAKPFALKTFQFLPHGQKCPFNVACGKAF